MKQEIKLNTDTTGRALLQAKIEAKLTKNEGIIFDVLIAQTLFYGKEADCLTDRTLSALAGGMRIDHARIARDGVINKGVFDAVESLHFDVCYSIPALFIKKGKNYAPHLNNDYSSKDKIEPTVEAPLSNQGFTDQQMVQLEAMMRSIHQEQGQVPKTGEDFPIKEQDSQTGEQFPKSGQTNYYIKPTLLNLPPLPLLHSSSASENLSKESLAKNNPSEKSGGVVLPLAINKQNQTVCLQALQGLSPAQVDNVLKTFDHKANSGVVTSPAGLFIHLANASREGRLILPDNVTGNAQKGTGHGSFALFSDDVIDEEKEAIEKRNSDLIWLKENAKREGVAIDVLAKQFGMENIVEGIRN